MLKFLLCRPGLLRCKHRWGVLTLLRISRILGVKVSIPLNSPVSAVHYDTGTGYIHALPSAAHHALCLGGSHYLLLLLLRHLDCAWILGYLHPLDFERLRSHPSYMHQPLHIQHIPPYVPLKLHLFLKYLSYLPEHI